MSFGIPYTVERCLKSPFCLTDLFKLPKLAPRLEIDVKNVMLLDAIGFKGFDTYLDFMETLEEIGANPDTESYELVELKVPAIKNLQLVDPQTIKFTGADRRKMEFVFKSVSKDVSLRIKTQ